MIVYCNRIREAFEGVPIVIVGARASLRRFAHYDYWSDTVRPLGSGGQRGRPLIYGMGERPVTQIASLLSRGVPVFGIDAFRAPAVSKTSRPKGEYVLCPSFESV